MTNKNKILLLVLSSLLSGCDSMQQTEDSHMEARTMIIGGVPVHEKDYKLTVDDQEAVNEVTLIAQR